MIPLEFIPLHFGEKLHIVNPRGYVGVVTLWSRISWVLRRFEEAGVNLDPKTSPVAVLGNLYGNGLKHLLRNLLYNPQLRYLVICGRDLSGSREELVNFFKLGVEEYEALGVRCRRVKGTNRLVDHLLGPELFHDPPVLVEVGDLASGESLARLARFFNELPPPPPVRAVRFLLPLPPVEVGRYPSNPRAHVVVAETPLEAWEELVFRIVRFGHLVHLKKGDRQELQNVKVVVERPVPDPPEELARYGFSLEKFSQYQRDILDPSPPGPDTSYRYGHRLRSYFGLDTLAAVARRLQEDSQDRHCYISLWDPARDLEGQSGRPCLVSLFFRVFEEKLTLTATFRTHNALDAWLENFYGLMAVQQHVAAAANLPPGAITVFSHSITVDPEEYQRARMVAAARQYRLRFDPHGNFRITVEDGQIVAYHLFGDMVINEYRGKSAAALAREIARDLAVSDAGHAMYLGRQLARAEACLAGGEPFEEG